MLLPVCGLAFPRAVEDQSARAAAEARTHLPALRAELDAVPSSLAGDPCHPAEHVGVHRVPHLGNLRKVLRVPPRGVVSSLLARFQEPLLVLDEGEELLGARRIEAHQLAAWAMELILCIRGGPQRRLLLSVVGVLDDECRRVFGVVPG